VREHDCPSFSVMTNPKPPDDHARDAAKQPPAASDMEERRKVIEEYAQSLREYLQRLRDRLN
jgi:hypothetical protein